MLKRKAAYPEANVRAQQIWLCPRFPVLWTKGITFAHSLFHTPSWWRSRGWGCRAQTAPPQRTPAASFLKQGETFTHHGWLQNPGTDSQHVKKVKQKKHTHKTKKHKHTRPQLQSSTDQEWNCCHVLSSPSLLQAYNKRLHPPLCLEFPTVDVAFIGFCFLQKDEVWTYAKHLTLSTHLSIHSSGDVRKKLAALTKRLESKFPPFLLH